MTVSLNQHRAVKYVFNCWSSFTNNSNAISLTGGVNCILLIYLLPKCFYISLLNLLCIFLFLLCNRDIEPKPVPRRLKQNFLTSLKTYISIYKRNFKCFSETYVDSTTRNTLLEIKDYNLVQADHLNNVKRGGVFVTKNPFLSES